MSICDHPDSGEQVESDIPGAEIVNLVCINDCDSYLSRVYYHDREDEPDDMYNTENSVVEGSDTALGERKCPPDTAVTAQIGPIPNEGDQANWMYRNDPYRKLPIDEFTQLVAQKKCGVPKTNTG